MNALTYLTRKCPRNCEYCDLVNNKSHLEINTPSWIKAFKILKELGVEFNLILGNETWLLGEGLVKIMEANEVPYALYSTAPKELFRKYWHKFFASGIDNFSCGIDYPIEFLLGLETEDDHDDTIQKSVDGWLALYDIRRKYPNVDCQGTVTVHAKNYDMLPEIVKDLNGIGVFCGINFIHFNSDGGFDFFPRREEIQEYLFLDADIPKLKDILDEIVEIPNKVQNIEMLKEHPMALAWMGWHCQGNPYGGPTIDSDGTLRCCGYRKGRRCSRYSIFDLPEKFIEYKEAVVDDAMECPGCFWSYPWMYNYWANKDAKFGREVFVRHAGEHINPEDWSTRKVQ